MKIIIKEVYHCDHCNKLYQRRNACLNHELVCSKNPNNQRACLSCANLVKKETTVYHDMPDGSEARQKVELLYCPAIDSFLYPPKVEHKKNFIELGDQSNEPMRVSCDLKQEHYNL